MTNRIIEYIRDPATGDPIASVPVEIFTHNGDDSVASTSTDANGRADYTPVEIGYPGPIYAVADSGTVRRKSGYVWGQLGGLIWADDFNDVFQAIGYGIISGMLNEFAVTANGSNLELTIATGGAILKDGLPYIWKENQAVTADAADGANPRKDRIVIRVYREDNVDQGKIEVLLLTGTPAPSPVVPVLTQNADVWDFPLYEINVAAGVTALTNGNLVSERTYAPTLPTGITRGDLFAVNSTGEVARLALGTSGQVVTSNGTDVSWGTIGAAALPTGIDAAKIADGSISNAEFQQLNNISTGSTIQSQIDGKAASAHTHAATDIASGIISDTEFERLNGVTSNIQTQINLKADANDPILTGNIEFDGPMRDNSSSTWTATPGTGMGTSPGAQTKIGNEYCGRIQQDTGSTGTNPGGILWTISFDNVRSSSGINVFLNPNNADTATVLPHVTSVSNSGFTIDCVGDPPNSTEMDVSWWVIDRV